MGIHITAGCVEVAIGHTVAGGANLVLGPLQIWLGWNMQCLALEGRFDLICEKSSYRPQGGKWFEVWKDSEEERGGYFLGRVWNLQTGSRMAGYALPSDALLAGTVGE